MRSHDLLPDEFFAGPPKAGIPPANPADVKFATITYSTGNLAVATDCAEQVLVRNPRLNYYQRSGELVRLATLRNDISDKNLFRPAGITVIQSLTKHALTETLDRLVEWKKPTAAGNAKVTECPLKVPEFLLARPTWQLPYLAGVISTPVLKQDGSILERPGYDKDTGLFLCSEEAWPEIPSKPSLDHAVKALTQLLEPFAEFPFCTKSDRAVHTSAILTAIQRKLQPSAPLFGFSAPQHREGKSSLSEGIGIIATGRKPAATATSAEPEEFRKALAAILPNAKLRTLDGQTHMVKPKVLAPVLMEFFA